MVIDNKTIDITKFFKSAGLTFFSVVLLCADRKGGATNEKYDKRVMARKRVSANGQQEQLLRNEAADGFFEKIFQNLLTR